MRTHNRSFVMGGASLTLARLGKHIIPVMNLVRDDFDALLRNNSLLHSAPFYWLSLSIDYGIKEDERPVYGRISKRNGDLPLNFEVIIAEVNTMSHDEFRAYLATICSRVLADVAKRYNLRDREIWHQALNLLSQYDVTTFSDRVTESARQANHELTSLADG